MATPEQPDLRTMSAYEFVRRLRERAGEPDWHYVFWLGAGCSVTSGIAAAGSLVREDWLPRLQRLKGAHRADLDSWAATHFAEYDPDNPAALYGSLMAELFPNREERQRETERLCEGPLPGFSYGVLAALMSRDDGILSASVTTNFDDLVADAMYVFGERRPLVIQHQALAGFVRPGRVRRPLVVKVHGDHRLNPMHTATETAVLEKDVARGVRRLLQDRGVIFIGYSGNDRGVIEMLEDLPDDALPLGVWWISRREPQGAIRGWLGTRDAVWVKADGFDELMLLFRNEFEIEHPTGKKFESMFDGYRRAYEDLNTRVQELPDTALDSAPLKEAARRASEDAPDWWGVELEASRYRDSDPDRADQIYKSATERLGDDPRLLGNYAIFVSHVRHHADRAQELYERAIAADPSHAGNLSNYAIFLMDVRGEQDRAQELFERAIAANPNHANTLSSYANFLTDVRGEHDRAQELFERAIAADPNHASSLTSYAVFIAEVRGEEDRAQELFERAIAANPDHAYSLSSYAIFLMDVRGEQDRAQELFERAIAANPNHANTLSSYANFLTDVRGEHDRAQELFERAIAADPNHANTLSSYANFLADVRGEHDRAQELFERAIAANPDHTNSLSNYAIFLTDVRGEHDRAQELFERAIASGLNPANDLGNYARLLLEQGDDARGLALLDRSFASATHDGLRVELWFYLLALGDEDRRNEARTELAALIQKGARSPGWDFSRILARAREEARPDIEWLEKLADVISERAEPEVLRGWEDWPGE